jgi:spermidine synthase
MTQNRSINRMPQLILFAVLFLSGVSALIYQIVWIRRFGLVFGVDVFTMATVLSAFMGGLAIGSLIFGRLADKIKSPIKLFMFLEFGIALFAFMFPITFKGLINIYSPIIQNFGLSDYSGQIVKFIFSFIYLLIPTTLMGGTLPVIFKFFVRHLNSLGWQISNLFAINNLGAVTGCFIAGFILIKTFGITTSLYIAASINFINAVVVFLISRRIPSEKTVEEKSAIIPENSDESNKLSKPLLRLVLWVFAIEGFATLAFEVIWTRIFIGFSFDKTTYFYSVIVLGFVFGLSLGSFIISKWIDKRKNLVTLLSILEIMIGLSSLALLMLFSQLSLILNLQRTIFDPWWKIIGKEYLMFFLILIIPATLTGMVYPIVSKLYADNIEKLGNRMGVIGFLDTIGSVLGSFMAGFILIPLLGVVQSFITIVAINIILGIMLLFFNQSMKKRLKAILLSGTLVLSLALFLGAPTKKYFSWWDKSRFEPWTNFVEKVPFYYEGTDATVTLRQYHNYIALNINGHNTAYTSLKDQIVNRMLGYVPYMVHPHPKRALVIGFGLGFTVESLIQREIDTVDVAEICSGVIKSGLAMNEWNKAALKNPKVHTYLEDGRDLLFRTRAKYDIITSNAVHPRLSNNIYTQDFYELCKSRMHKGGIMCQWATPNWMNENEFKAQVKAFINAFTYCQLWYINEYTIILIGSEEPLRIDYALISERFKDSKVKDDLLNINMTEPFEFVSQFSMERNVLMNYCQDAASNTDDYPIVEFSKTVNLAPDTSALQFIYDAPDNYGNIDFGSLSNDTIKNEILRKMAFSSLNRKRMVKETIESVKFQVKEYKKTGKAPKF